jgi:hypothetical protein
LKVFGIGLNKTGTSTLGAAGELLGLRDKSWDAGLFHDTMIEGRRDRLWRAIDEFDLFNDFPYPLLYPEIDARYPNAKFVLTRRSSPEVWLSSIKSHSMRASPSSRTHRVVYGLRYPHGCEDLYLEYYKRHFETAREYFANRPDDFLEICWEEEGDLSRLADFLGREAPAGPVPRANEREGKRVNPLRYSWNCGGLLLQTLRGK